MVFLISLVLTLIPLFGIAWIVLFSSVTTVDGLFMSLILLAISGIFGGNALYDLRKPRAKSATAPAARLRPGAPTSAVELSQRGKVEKVEFFEANVGQTNKSIVTFSNGEPAQLLVFEGDLRNALPAGHKVQITFRKAGGYNVLTNVSSA
jgi:hypothetical protein